MTGYVTWGPVRGSCRHEHKTVDTAQRCVDRDARGRIMQHGYSDRRVYEAAGVQHEHPIGCVVTNECD